MRNLPSKILYLFIIILVLLGLFLFIFKDNVADSFLSYDISGEPVSVVKTNNDLKLDILRDSRVKVLKNYINIFNYENLDASQEIIQKNANKQNEVIISNPDDLENSTSTVKSSPSIRVRVGNSNPFLINKAVK